MLVPWSRRFFIVLLLFASIVPFARGQSNDVISDDARFWLMTILPGDEIYSTWGHSAIRVHDPERGFDVSFNYGTFDFDAYFLPKFLYGELDYLLSVQDYHLALASYREAERPVIEQELRLSAAQKDSLFAFLQINALPENRVYRYHFLYDNCSTRIRDVFEQALGTDISFADAPDPGKSFRHLLDSGLRVRPFIDAGIDWLFGSPVDRVAQPYETMFLPVYLMDAFDQATIQIEDRRMPLVASADTVFWIPDRSTSMQTFPWATTVAWCIFVMGLYVTVRNVAGGGRRGDVRSGKGGRGGKGDRGGQGARGGEGGSAVARWFDVPLFTLVGLAGIIIAFLWFVSLHDVTERNWHLLWSWPTHVIVAVALWRRSSEPWVSAYLLAAAAVALTIAALGPFLNQWIHPALYPIMLVTTLRGGWIFIAQRRRAVPTPVTRT
jgi:hypothetical protein